MGRSLESTIEKEEASDKEMEKVIK